jgi:hypothetical protein
MTTKDIEGELEKQPFIPLRVHLVSGKTIDIPFSNAAWLLQNALLVFQHARPGKVRIDGYDVIALRNIERVEQRPRKPRSSAA